MNKHLAISSCCNLVEPLESLKLKGWNHITRSVDLACEKDLSQQLFEVMTNEDVKREKLRAVLAIGAIALLYYLRVMNEGHAFELIHAHPAGYFSAVTTDEILLLWGLYVVATAVALTGAKFAEQSNTLRLARQVLKGAYYIGHMSYFFAASILFLVALYYIVLLAIVLYLFVIPAIIFGMLYALRKRENRQRVVRMLHLTK